MVRATLWALLGTLTLGAAPSQEDPKFAKRFQALKKKAGLVSIQMAPDEDPSHIKTDEAPSGVVPIAAGRMGLVTPEVLSQEDILQVVNKNMISVRRCYKKQLKKDPEWSDDLILDLAIKKTGRVSEVSVAPRRVKKDVIGRCLMRSVPKWKFPSFTGETEEGITQEVINASFPFAFSAK